MELFSYIRKLFRSPSLPESVDALFFGLGNPGKRYDSTRHNIGFRVARALSQRLGDGKNGYFAGADFVGGKLFSKKNAVIVCPRTFMNRSGDAVAAYLERCHFPAASMMVIVDDYNLPLGKLRARRGGSDGGHNGLKSISGRIGEDFPRLRVGIGPLPEGSSAIDFVLGSFTRAEDELLNAVIPRAAEACMLFAQDGIDAVMNMFNK